MSGIANNPNSPRQKMINLMYLVFIAMMAMNDTSSEVLSGFELVEKSLRESTTTAADRNRKTLEELEAANRVNPAKVGEWYAKGKEVKKQSDELFEYIQQLKLRIVRQADGKDGNVDQIQHKEDLDAASEVMLADEPRGIEAEEATGELPRHDEPHGGRPRQTRHAGAGDRYESARQVWPQPPLVGDGALREHACGVGRHHTDKISKRHPLRRGRGTRPSHGVSTSATIA